MTTKKVKKKAKPLVEDLMGELLDTIKDSKTFLKAELPDVAKEILIFDFWEALIWCFFSTKLIFLPGLVVFYSHSPLKEYFKWGTEGSGLFLFFFGLAALVLAGVGMCEFIGNLLKMIQIKTAPKYYLTEKLSKMARR